MLTSALRRALSAGIAGENRSIMLQNATRLAMEDLGIMPVHFQFAIWATKKSVAYTPRTDEYTLAFQFKPVGPKP